MGLSAVPLPTKIRRMLPGCQAPTAEAPGDGTVDPTDATGGSPLLTDAAGTATRAAPPNSRRLAAAADHANVADGSAPPFTAPSHASMPVPIAFTDPDAAAARGAEVITGGAAAAGAITSDDASAACMSGSLTAAGSELATPETTAPETTAPETTAPETRSGRRRGFLRALRTALPPRITGAGLSPVGAPLSVGAPVSVESLRVGDGDVPRARDDDCAVGDDEEVDDEVDVVDPEPLEPAEPVVSAKAIGIDTTAAPTPRATAKAPTRPI